MQPYPTIMREKEAKKKYGKFWKKMQEHLAGCTCEVLPDGELDIYEIDLQRTYDLVTKGYSNISWD